MKLLVEVLDMLLAAINNSPATSPTNAEVDECVPTMQDATRLYETSLPTLTGRLGQYLDSVRHLWSVASGLALTNILEEATDVATSQPRPTAPRNLYGSTVESLDYRLTLHDPRLEVALARDLVDLPRDTALSRLTADPQSLGQGLKELRRLEDLLIRVLAASQVTRDHPGLTMAEVLALHRTEGNLGVPRSASSLELGIPPWLEPAPEKSIARWGHAHLKRPNFSRLVLLESFQNYLSVATTDDGRLQVARDGALLMWLLHLIGFDVITKPGSMLARAPAHMTAADAFALLLATTRGAHNDSLPITDSRTWGRLVETLDQALVYRTLEGELQQATTVSALASSRFFIRSAAKDPVAFLSKVLAQAVLLMRYVGMPHNIGFFEPVRRVPSPDLPRIVPPHMTYVMYNSGAHRGVQVLISAVSRAILLERSVPTHRGLRDEIAGHPIWSDDRAVARTVSATPDEQLKDLTETVGPEFKNWMLDPTRGRMRIHGINNFIATASPAEWKAWNSPTGSVRGNAFRYAEAFQYYHRLTGEAAPY